jgi:hypothetical protein
MIYLSKFDYLLSVLAVWRAVTALSVSRHLFKVAAS